MELDESISISVFVFHVHLWHTQDPQYPSSSMTTKSPIGCSPWKGNSWKITRLQHPYHCKMLPLLLQSQTNTIIKHIPTELKCFAVSEALRDLWSEPWEYVFMPFVCFFTLYVKICRPKTRKRSQCISSYDTAHQFLNISSGIKWTKLLKHTIYRLIHWKVWGVRPKWGEKTTFKNMRKHRKLGKIMEDNDKNMTTWQGT